MNIEAMARKFERLLQMAREIFGRRAGGEPPDPFAYTMAPTKKRPPQRSGAVAVAEPDATER
jgi:hypothetical protein